MANKDSSAKAKRKTGEKKGSKPSSHSTLGFLIRRMRHTKDFPAFSQNLLEINQKASPSGGNYASASELANAILKDYSVTNKLLRLVNSAYYGSLAGNVTTVSRAVVMLGFDQVRVSAASIILFEHLGNSEQRKELQEETVHAFLSGVVARKLSEHLGIDEWEEAFICSMLHSLGKLLVVFYLPKEYERINALLAKGDTTESVASRKVLGLAYNDLGKGIASAWKFPGKIVSSMEVLPPGTVSAPKSEEDSLKKLSYLSNRLCRIVKNQNGGERSKLINDLLRRFGDCYSISEEGIQDVLLSSAKDLKSYSDALNLNLQKSELGKSMADFQMEYNGDTGPQKQVVPSGDEAPPPDENGIYDMGSSVSGDADPQAVLISGIEDISNLLMGEYELKDLLTIILEIIYRGFRFARVIFCMINNMQTRMVARLGFGKDVEEIMGDFRFALGDKSNVFGLALSLGKDIRIDDTGNARIREKIPDWYRMSLFSPAFVLFPIHVDGRPLAVLYADREKAGKVIDENQLNFLRILRNQAALAIKQKC